MKAHHLFCLVGLLTYAALSGAPARAGGPSPASAAPPLPPIDKAACLDAVSKGQRARDTHKLVEAREKFRVCGRAECPGVVQTDCAGWLAEVERALPTVVLSAKDGGGHDVVDVKVSVDGQPFASSLDGQALGVDPGMRTFRFERAEGKPATVQVLVKEGEKAQVVSVNLSGGEPPLPSLNGEVTANVPPPPGTSRPGTVARLLALLMGGGGVAALGVGAGLAIDAKVRDAAAAGEPGMARATDSASAVNQGTTATIIGGVGGALAVAGLVLWIAAPSGRSDSGSASPEPGRGLAMGTDGRAVFVWGSF
jgi:hypothetical protein